MCLHACAYWFFLCVIVISTYLYFCMSVSQRGALFSLHCTNNPLGAAAHETVSLPMKRFTLKRGILYPGILKHLLM